jgi:BirA family biotin operon repressor/biotin-[acetyl-CoA-carboxylase] ligase
VLADVEVVQETGSTNTDLMQRLATLERPLLLVAERQTAGRGRAGRSWLSVPGRVLTFSLAWKLPQSGAQLMGLPLVIGLAFAETLKALAVPVRLKWPNDIWRDGKKMGVSSSSPHRQRVAAWIVGGIGLNLLVPEAWKRPSVCRWRMRHGWRKWIEISYSAPY